MFFKTYWNWLDQQLGLYLTHQLTLLAQTLEPAVVIFASIAIMGWGYLLLAGRVDRSLEETIQKLIKIMLILGVSLKLWGLNDVLVNWVIDGPSALFAAVNGTTDTVAAIDQTWDNSAIIAGQLYDNTGVLTGDFYNYWWSIAIYVTAGYLCLYVMFLLSLAKIAATLILALAPLFVACLLFDSMRSYFDSWVHELANFTLISLLTGMMQALIMSLVSSYALQTSQLGKDIKTNDSIDLVLTCVLSILLLHQVIPIAARLSGGYSLNTASWPERATRWAFNATRGLAITGLSVGTSLLSQDDVERE